MPINRIYGRVIFMSFIISLFGAAVIYSISFSEYKLSVVISTMILITIGFIMWKRLHPKQD